MLILAFDLHPILNIFTIRYHLGPYSFDDLIDCHVTLFIFKYFFIYFPTSHLLILNIAFKLQIEFFSNLCFVKDV